MERISSISDPALPFAPSSQSSPKTPLNSTAPSSSKSRQQNLKRKRSSFELVQKEMEEAKLKLQLARVKFERMQFERNLQDTVIVSECTPTPSPSIDRAVKKYYNAQDENRAPKTSSICDKSKNRKSSDSTKKRTSNDSQNGDEIKKEQKQVTAHLNKLKSAPTCTENAHDLYMFASFINMGVDAIKKFEKAQYLYSLDTVKSIISKLPFAVQLRCIDYMSYRGISRSTDVSLVADYLNKEASKCAPFIDFENPNSKRSK